MSTTKFTLFPKTRSLQGINRLSVWLCVGLLAWGAGGCNIVAQTPTPTLMASLMDRSVLTDQPCVAPCWYDLELGKSTTTEAIVTLKTLPFLAANTIHEEADGYWDPTIHNDVPSLLVSAECTQPQQQCVGLEFVNDILMGVGLFPNYSLSLREVVTHLGPPDYVGADMDRSNTMCNLALIWIKRQTTIRHFDRSSQTRQKLCQSVQTGESIDSALTVDVLYYDLPQQFADIPQAGFHRPWPGFTTP